MYGSDDAQQLACCHAFQNISPRTDFEGINQVILAFRCGQDGDFNHRILVCNHMRRIQPTIGHVNVQQDHVGQQVSGEPDRIFSRSTLTDDFHILFRT